MADQIAMQGLTVSYDGRPVLKGLDLAVREHEILSIIGPAHSGKTTLLRTINRLDDDRPGYRRQGQVLLGGREVRTWETARLRRRVGMIFATPLPLPGTIFDNVAYGPRLQRRLPRAQLLPLVEECLRAAFLWDEVRSRLDAPASRLSGGQQQRLCIARTMAVNPEVIMMDEPCSGLDPISTAQIENAMRELKAKYTFMLVTNNVKQAARVSDRVAFLLAGELVELGTSEQIFTRPKDARTDDYVSGRIG